MHWMSDPSLYPPYLRSRIRRGRGVGLDASYIPWLKVRDVPSRGTSSTVSGILSKRPHHLLSELEATYFFQIERRHSTVNILEQWPILDIDRTLELCAATGVRHNFRGPFPEPFTIDFLITENIDGALKVRAASIKTKEDAQTPAIRQRLAIEYQWCLEKGIPWTLVETASFNKEVLSNLRFMRGWHRHGFDPEKHSRHGFSQHFLDAYAFNVPLGELIRRTAKSLRLDQNTAQDFFRYCAWSDQIPVSLKHPLSLGNPLILKVADA